MIAYISFYLFAGCFLAGMALSTAKDNKTGMLNLVFFVLLWPLFLTISCVKEFFKEFVQK